MAADTNPGMSLVLSYGKLVTYMNDRTSLKVLGKIKECYTTVKQVFFSYTTEGSLVDTL